MKHWVFDLDGTLIDSHAIYFKSLRKVFGHFGVELTEAAQKEILSLAVRERKAFFERRLGFHNAALAAQLLDEYLVEDDTQTQAFDGIKDLLESLKSQNKVLAVWTAREMLSAKRTIESVGLEPYFTVYMSGSCVDNCKPHPEGLERIAETLGCATSDLIMVGDHDNDMLAAKACGAKAIRALWNDPKTAKECHLSDFSYKQVAHLSESLF